MIELSGVEWRNATAMLSYPFTDDSTLTSVDGIRLPYGFVLDAVIYARGMQQPVWLAGIRRNDAGDVVCRFTDGHVSVEGGDRLLDADGREAGRVVLGDGAKAAFSGVMTFNEGATNLVVGCVVPIPGQRLTAVEVEGVRFSGDVHIAAEQGVKLVLEDDGSVRVDAYGEKLTYQDPNAPRPVRGIRLVISGREVGVAYATADGRFTLRDDNSISPDTLLRFVPRPGGLTATLIGGAPNA